MKSAVLASFLSLLLIAGGLALATPAAAGEDTPAKEAGRKNAIKGLKSKIRKLANSKWASKKVPDLLKHLEALSALGGKEAGLAALEALPHIDTAVRDAAFAIIEREHDKSFTKHLAARLEDKRFRRDYDARRRIAHALAVVSDPAAIQPLADLIRFDEDAEVVAEAADSLAGYGTAPIKLRKEGVRRLVDLYETTWNLKMSVRPEDKILRKKANERYKVYGKSLRFALQGLTSVQLTRPQEWRRWWNSNKKKKKWGRESTMPPRRGK